MDAHKIAMSAFTEAVAVNLILHEIVRDLARTYDDPSKYLASKFERISRRLDQGRIEDEAYPSVSETRAKIAEFFSVEGQNLN
jgi:hypothetical protein